MPCILMLVKYDSLTLPLLILHKRQHENEDLKGKMAYVQFCEISQIEN